MNLCAKLSFPLLSAPMKLKIFARENVEKKFKPKILISENVYGHPTHG
jgi:hypothetical protein